MKRGWRGINSLHTKSNRYTHLSNLGLTDMFKYVNVRNIGGTENSISVCPIHAMTRAYQFRSDRLHHLGDTDLMTEGNRRLATHSRCDRVSESENLILLGFGLWLKWFISVCLSLAYRWDQDYF